jgi:tetratricopeptide (TPR) repeat protein
MEAIDRGVPDDVAEEIYEAVAKGHMAAYRLRDAWMCLDVWLQWRPNAPHARMMRASIFEQTGDLDQAVADYRAVIEIWPEHRDAQIRLGQVLLRMRAYQEAREVFQARVEAVPDDAEALLGLAQSERWLGNDSEAKRRAEAAMALGLSPYHQGLALEELGRALLKEGKHEEAIAALTKALTLAPGEGLIHHALGMALARAGRTDEARAHQERLRHIQAEYDRMTQITRNLMDHPLSADLRCEAGAILMDQGLKKEGADWLLTALRCDPSHRNSHQLLAEYYAEAGNQSLAAHHRLLAAQPSKPQKPPERK